MFICEAHGAYLDWKFDSVHRTIFFHDQSVDDVQTVSGQGLFKLRSILTGNEALTEIPGRRLTSTLIIELTESSRDSHNVTCSSDTEMQVFTFQTAGRW